MGYRAIAASVVDLHNKYGASIVSLKDSSDLLEQIMSLELRVKEDAPTREITETHLTRKNVRKAIWELKGEHEWLLDHGVIWTSIEGGSSYIGLGLLVPADTVKSALMKTINVGGEDDGRTTDE